MKISFCKYLLWYVYLFFCVQSLTVCILSRQAVYQNINFERPLHFVLSPYTLRDSGTFIIFNAKFLVSHHFSRLSRQLKSGRSLQKNQINSMNRLKVKLWTSIIAHYTVRYNLSIKGHENVKPYQPLYALLAQ